ncbi:MAG TPA: hypothetical protein VLA13_09510 [Massilibacterium sp.]|nr:hypothetical protein [Massilibacterium sp.]
MTIFEKLKRDLVKERTVHLYNFKKSILIREGFHTFIKLTPLNDGQMTISVTNLREGLYYDIFKKQCSDRADYLVRKVKEGVMKHGYKVLDVYKKV